MIIAVALLVAAGLAGRFGHVILERITTCCAPKTAIVSWLVSMLAVPVAFAAGVVLLLVPGSGPTASLVGFAHDCWANVHHADVPEIDELAGGLGGVFAAGAASRLAYVAARSYRARRRVLRAHRQLLAVTAPTADIASAVLWLPSDRPLAYCVGGRPGLVVASTGLRRLPRDQVAAILDHERAHLTGRHHAVIAVAHALAAAGPGIPLFRVGLAALRLLVETAADDTSVRDHGRSAVEAALLAVDGHTGPRYTLANADGDVAARVERLRRTPPDSGWTRRAAARTAATLAPVMVPALAGATAIFAAVFVLCPSGS